MCPVNPLSSLEMYKLNWTSADKYNAESKTDGCLIHTQTRSQGAFIIQSSAFIVCDTEREQSI